MKIYIYDWELKETSPRVRIVAHALDESNKYTQVIITDFEPFCYVSPEQTQYLKNVVKKEKVAMRSSTNINQIGFYTKVYYQDYHLMKKECDNIGHMMDIDVIILYLSHKTFHLQDGLN